MSWRPSPLGFLTTAALVLPGLPAMAHHAPDHTCTGSAEVRGGGGVAGGECASPGEPGPDIECDPVSGEVWYYDDPPSDMIEEYLKVEIASPHPEGMIYQAAYNCAGVHLGGPYLVPDPNWPDIQAARDAAEAIVTPTMPNPRVSPSEAVVNFPTWLWVDEAYWQTASATASQGAVTVRVDASPKRVTWNLDEGQRICSGAGIPWSEEAQEVYDRQSEDTRGRGNPACTFTFEHSSSTREDGLYHATVTVEWEFSWWLNGAAQGVFGSTAATSSFDLKVGEIQALITEY